MTLYEIDKAIADCVDEETGEIFDVEKLDALNMERDRKIENIAHLCENVKNDIAGLKEQEQIFAARRKSAEKKLDSLKEYLTYALGGQRFETVAAKVTFRKGYETVIDDEKLIPSDYWTQKVTETVNKTAIKEAIKSGKEVPGAHVSETLNPQINAVRGKADA